MLVEVAERFAFFENFLTKHLVLRYLLHRFVKNQDMKTGDTVVCVKSNPDYPALKRGNEYVIGGVFTCACGKVYIDVGLPLPFDCCACRYCDRIVSHNVAYFDIIRFRKLESYGYTNDITKELAEKATEQKPEIQIIEPELI